MNTTPPVISVTEELLAELEEVANKATPGPWTAVNYPDLYDKGDHWMVDTPSRPADIFDDGIDAPEFSPNHHDEKRGEKDMKFIAAANPATVLALIARIRELRKDAERYRWLRDPCSGAERVVMYGRGDFGRGLMSYTMLDAAIDAAMPSPPKEGV